MAGAGGLPARQQLVAAVTAGVGERAQRPVVAAHQQHAARTRVLGPLVTRMGELVRAADAQPAAPEEVPLFPGEHRRVHVGGGRQHPALPEGPQGVSYRGRTQRRRLRSRPHPAQIRSARRRSLRSLSSGGSASVATRFSTFQWWSVSAGLFRYTALVNCSQYTTSGSSSSAKRSMVT